MRGRIFRNYYERHMDTTIMGRGEDRSKGGRWVLLDWGGSIKGQCRQLKLNNKIIVEKHLCKLPH